MMADALDLLACPVCRGALRCEAIDAQNGWLVCDACVSLTPLLFGMVLFTETRYAGSMRPDIGALAAQLVGSQADYRDYIDDKRERGLVDAYAAFEPFAESMRCAAPVLRAARDRMDCSDAVLDLGTGAGWSGAMLAGLFPQQHVVCICWSGAGVLGYRGFRHWLADAQHLSNLLIVFSPITAALPVRDGAFALVHSCDSLHRSLAPTLCNDTLRAANPDATIVHSHVHLADAEPEPYFERGGILRSAGEYRGFFATRLRGDPRTALLVSEGGLFAAVRAGDIAWDALEKAGGYNGLIAIGGPEVLEAAQQNALIRPAPMPDQRMLANPLLRINPLTGAVHIDQSALGGRAQEMLARHPPFADALRSHLAVRVDLQSIELLRAAESGATIAEAARVAGVAIDAMLARVASLVDQEILVAAPFGHAYHSLHRFHCNARSVLDPDFGRALAEWTAHSPDSPGGTIFDNQVNRREALLIVSALVGYLRRLAVGPCDPVAVAASGRDALWPIAACLLVGAHPVGDVAAARVAVVDRHQGHWEREICIEDDPAAPITLARVLSAYVDDSDDTSDAGHADNAKQSALHWMDFIQSDAQGRLQLLRDGEPAVPVSTSIDL